MYVLILILISKFWLWQFHVHYACYVLGFGCNYMIWECLIMNPKNTYTGNT